MAAEPMLAKLKDASRA